jgi:hypothetical protein
MDFNPCNPKYPQELIDSSFQREVKFSSIMTRYKWGPKNIKVEENLKTISFDWHGDTLDQAELPSSWKIQLEQIVKDLKDNNIYKPNFYQKCFYLDEDQIIHAFSFYSTSTEEEQPIAMDFYRPILNEDRLSVVDELSSNGMLNMEVLIKRAYSDYIKWPDNALKEIFNNVYR